MIDGSLPGSSQKKIKEGVVLRSMHVCGFSDHINEILPQKGGSVCLVFNPHCCH